ncbi:hypothetical protein NGM37_53475, partial [Streptomyces sp. TRM76130]|nr:hypothetical protein [Streptomyces sp. TRM76130]
ALSAVLALASLAVISPFREALYRVKDFFASGSAAGATELQGAGEELNGPAPATSMPCSHCGAHSSVTVVSRPVG